MEANHPIYRIKRVGSENTVWVHHNRLRKRKPFQNPAKPGNKIESDIFEDLDEDMSEVDYPLIINNTRREGVGNPETNNQTKNNEGSGDYTDIISLDENAEITTEDPTADDVPELEQFLEDEGPLLGRVFDNQGRLVSSRNHAEH